MVEAVGDEVGVDLEVGPAQLVRLYHCPRDGGVPAVVAPGVEEGLVDRPPHKVPVDHLLHPRLLPGPEHIVEGILAVLQQKLALKLNVGCRVFAESFFGVDERV